MIEEVIPAIKAIMPRPPGQTIFVQHVGSKPHTGKGSMEAIQDAAKDDITRANPPDVNPNDLGFSHSIQQLKEDVELTNGEELVEAIIEAPNVYPLEDTSTSLVELFCSLWRSHGVQG
ncbi:unnamed protein product [Discosporangium mesarthrocarpum]